MSDSDRTIDSDELEEVLKREKKKIEILPGRCSPSTKAKSKVQTERTVHSMSDSEDSDEHDNTSRSKSQEPISAKRKHMFSRDTNDSPSKKKTSYQNSKGSNGRSEAGPSTSHSSSTSKPVRSNTAAFQAQSREIELHSYFGCYFTKVSGIASSYNEKIALSIKDLLSQTMGTLKRSVQFNYMIDIDWLMQQYPAQFRSCPLLLVYGLKRGERDPLAKAPTRYSNVSLCQAKLDIAYGTHHTKMMILLYEDGMRVVIHTANLIEGDWHQKTQGLWVSPLFPPLQESSTGDSSTGFRTDLLKYLTSYGKQELVRWCEHIQRHDFSAANVYLIASLPGRHVEHEKSSFGHLKLRQVLNTRGPSEKTVSSSWPVVAQFSSIGSLGNSPDQWLCKEFLTSLCTVKGGSASLGSNNSQLKLIYPSVDNVRTSLEGYPAGASLPYSIHVARKQPYLKSFLHRWQCDAKGRTRASPHLKSYLRISPEMDKAAWFLITSANLSKAAWGCLEKGGTQLMIRSYELGVLFMPNSFGSADYFQLSSRNNTKITDNQVLPFPLFYDMPLAKYEKSDEPWIWDIPHISAPDSHGNKWCPP